MKYSLENESISIITRFWNYKIPTSTRENELKHNMLVYFLDNTHYFLCLADMLKDVLKDLNKSDAPGVSPNSRGDAPGVSANSRGDAPSVSANSRGDAPGVSANSRGDAPGVSANSRGDYFGTYRDEVESGSNRVERSNRQKKIVINLNVY